MLAEAERVTAIPRKRVPPPGTQFLDAMRSMRFFAGLPQDGEVALRDRALLLFLYNTGARVQEDGGSDGRQPRARTAAATSICTAKVASGGPARSRPETARLLSRGAGARRPGGGWRRTTRSSASRHR